MDKGQLWRAIALIVGLSIGGVLIILSYFLIQGIPPRSQPVSFEWRISLLSVSLLALVASSLLDRDKRS